MSDSPIQFALYTNGTVIKADLWPFLQKAAFIRVSVDAATSSTHAAMHGYTTAFAVAAGIFAAGALIAGLLFERGVKRVEPAGAPVLAH